MGGFVQSDIGQIGGDDQLDLATDTTVMVTYSAPLPDDSKIEFELSTNLPTGRSALNNIELLAVPNASAVSVFGQGVGLDFGINSKYHRKVADRYSGYVGGGITRRGAYDPTTEEADDDISGGLEYSVVGGVNYQYRDDLSIGANTYYSISREIGEQDGSATGIGFPVFYLASPYSVYARYDFNYGDSLPSRATASEKRQQFNQGFYHTGTLEGEWDATELVSVRGVLEYSQSTAERPIDPSYFSIDKGYSAGAGISLQIEGTPFSLDGSIKYTLLSTIGSDFDSVEFDAYTSIISVSASF